MKITLIQLASRRYDLPRQEPSEILLLILSFPDGLKKYGGFVKCMEGEAEPSLPLHPYKVLLTSAEWFCSNG